jgi:hypothetical protein
MIACQECGAENRLGTIFCHSCGAKLDLDAVQPVIESGKHKQKKKGTGLRNIIALIVLVVIAGVLAGIFVKAELPVKVDVKKISQDRMRHVHQRYQRILRSMPGSSRQFKFSAEDLTLLANAHCDLLDENVENNAEEGAVLVPVKLSIKPVNEQQLLMVLKSRLMDKTDVYSTVNVKILPAEGDDDASYKIISAKAGAVPVFGPFKEKILERFPFYGDRRFEGLAKRIAGVQVVDNGLIITTK